MLHFQGIYTPIITPYHPDGTIHWDALANAVAYLVKHGVDGIISGGSTGENYTQTVAERIALARFTKAQIQGAVPFILGTGAMLSAESLALAQAARELCADAIMLASPPYAVPTDYENAHNALAIDKVAKLPIMLYNYPGRTGVTMGTDFLDCVAQSKNFCAIKESSGDINRLHLLAHDYPHIELGCGMDDQALEFFAWGARFWVCGGSNFLPAEHIALYQACVLENDFCKGRHIMSAMLPLMRTLEQGGKFIQTIKYGASLQGIAAGSVRPPLQDLNEEDKHTLQHVVRTLQQKIATITKTDTRS